MSASPSSRADRAYRHIKTEILTGRFRPATTLNEQELGRLLHVSRTPVREAIRKLEQEGLVIRHPNRGAMVTLLSMKEVLELWEVREILEVAACRLTTSRRDHEGLLPLRAALEELRDHTREPSLEHYERHHELDLALHGAIFRATGNRTLCRMSESVNQRILLARIVSSPTRFHESVREHLEIVAAVLGGDPDEAARAMSRHLAHARETVYSRM